MIREFKGNIFESRARIIAHGCNCVGLMGAGLAAQMSQRFPEMYKAYQKLCDDKEFNPGSCFLWSVEWDSELDHFYYIANLGTQFYPGRNAKMEYIKDSVAELLFQAHGLFIDRVAIPRLGCGIGGLAWDDVLLMLEEEFGRHNVDIDVYFM
ncbi:phosphatase [Rhodococcus phage Weasels2]|uniref:Phosphatase n=1 Tax=Rhodococcus phage Weasels2 TaxID=1897437 RepID=A0A1I9SAK3_9CAUD|nr:phosphatase [Rhodococcus phage Weasels2]AOZ63809.1 phosphatase [Rhodococcus phage Weasels2]